VGINPASLRTAITVGMPCIYHCRWHIEEKTRKERIKDVNNSFRKIDVKLTLNFLRKAKWEVDHCLSIGLDA